MNHWAAYRTLPSRRTLPSNDSSTRSKLHNNWQGCNYIPCGCDEYSFATMLVLGEQTNLIFIRENLYRIVATRWARSAAVEMLSRPAIAVLCCFTKWHVRSWGNSLETWRSDLIINQFDTGQDDLGGSANIDWVAFQMCRQVFGRPKNTTLYMCRVNFGAVWLSWHLHVSILLCTSRNF